MWDRIVVKPRTIAKMEFAIFAIGFACFAAPLITSFVVTPQDIESGSIVLSSPCQSMVVLGHPCPTCGLTRAFTALSHGDWSQAVAYHAIAPAIYAIFWGLTAFMALKSWSAARALIARPYSVPATTDNQVRLPTRPGEDAGKMDGTTV